MSISVIGASSRMPGRSRSSDLQHSSSQEKCRECMQREKSTSIEIVGEPLLEKQNEMSIAYLHKKVEKELKEKQRKIALLRQGITPLSPISKPRKHVCSESKCENTVEESSEKRSFWSSLSRSHQLIFLCISSVIVMSIVILIILFVFVLK